MGKIKKNLIRIASVFGAFCFTAGTALQTMKDIVDSGVQPQAASLVNKTSGLGFESNVTDYFDKNVVQKLTDKASEDVWLSVIVDMKMDSVMDVYADSDSQMSLGDYIHSNDGRRYASKIDKSRQKFIEKLNKSGITYTVGEKYETIMSGFEVTIHSSDFEKLSKLYGNDATLIIGEEYEKCDSQVIHNDVDVYETGIFDSSSCAYKGEGVVVAVLDTGLDYTHPAFLEKNFTGAKDKDALKLSDVRTKVNDTVAATLSPGLIGDDVYVSRKVPFAYDYADKDPDVLPIDSEHGTHVAGVIAGDDDVITGVAPKAQLAIMKVFSDTQPGAKTPWILAAVEDCVNMEVDVINMSLGTSCGFAREVDEENVNKVYDKVKEAGISLIVAASNDNNATAGSTKNGSNGLTSNPDSGTVGSPSTYAGALSVASVDGVKTPYLLYNGDIIYFNEASTSGLEKKNFVDEILRTVEGNPDSYDFEYISIPGTGASSDYDSSIDYTGKIALVRRGSNTFEEKVRVALKEKGAAGIIIYNNVSGSISMSIGANVGAVCSISQDEGEILAAAKTGKITISRKNVAGPFMSSFSSWGPTSDLQIKPEITAHGGEILSAIPGNDYDRLSGTSMAAPNQAGATALIRQYVKFSGVFGTFGETAEDARKITKLVNQLMMSTTDIVKNKNGIPFAVRKQGAGLVNISKSTTTAAYLATFDKNGNEMDKTKLELGDDKQKTGVYKMEFAIQNISDVAVSYKIDAFLMTEGVSTTYTSHGDRTVDMEGRAFNDTQMKILSVDGGTHSTETNTVSVEKGKQAKVTIEVKLSDAAKKYMDKSFEHGMYVEGFVKLQPTAETFGNMKGVAMSIPVLAFYGDWTEAPIFDEEYYDTNKDELDAGIDAGDKVMEDAYATRVVGGLYSDYISMLGTYYFEQNPANTQIAADKKYIAISNVTSESSAGITVNSIASIWAGLLRNVKEAKISIVEDATGKEIFTKSTYNIRKSYSYGASVRQAFIDVDFSALEHNLKNNSKYTVTVETFIDYGEQADQKNVRNVFEFPLYIDFEAPVVTDVTYRTEYDRNEKKTKLYADISVYDNHYAMGIQAGQVLPYERLSDSDPYFTMETFGKYLTPVYSSFNSTSKVTIELTDYIQRIRNSVAASYNDNGALEVVENSNSIIAICYDYAMNSATYEINLPDEILDLAFTKEEIVINPYETLDLTTVLDVFPATSWEQLIDFEITEEKPDASGETKGIISISNQTLLAQTSGTAVLTAYGYNVAGERVEASVKVHVLGEGDEGYYGDYTPPEVSKFALKGYKTNKAFYSISSSERGVGLTGGSYSFGASANLSMYPSESVTLTYELSSYYPQLTKVDFSVGNEDIATIDQNGKIVARAKGTTIASVEVLFKNGDEYESTPFGARVAITVKDPYAISSIYLSSYRGDEEIVEIPDDRGITTIAEYAFSGFEYAQKTQAEIDASEKGESKLKQAYLGQNENVKKVIIPEGVTHIKAYAFAGMPSLEEVVLPDSLVNIAIGAFENCKKLSTINLGKVKFINEKAFSGATSLKSVDLSGVVAIGNYTFEGCSLLKLTLPKSSQSLGVGAFADNKYLNSIEFMAEKIKIGEEAFKNCTSLQRVTINAAVISAKSFYGCKELKEVAFGPHVAFIGEFAFSGTMVSKFEVDFRNPDLSTDKTKTQIIKGNELIMVAPQSGENDYVLDESVKSIASGAFSGNAKIFSITAPGVTNVGAYAFAECANLDTVSMDAIQTIGDYAFYKTQLSQLPKTDKLTEIGAHAFESTKLTSVNLPNKTKVGAYAFAGNSKYLEEVKLGDKVELGEYAFYSDMDVHTVERSDGLFYSGYYKSYIYELKDENGKVIEKFNYYVYDFEKDIAVSTLWKVEIGNNVTIGAHAFEGNWKLNNLTLGQDIKIGEKAFYNARSLKTVDLSGVLEIGDYAFSGETATEIELYKVTSQVGNDRREEIYPRYGYEREHINGVTSIIDYKYVHFAPMLEEVNLSKLTKLGKFAFAYNDQMTELTLGQNFKEIPAYAFYGCKNLNTINFTSSIQTIGDYAFFRAGIDELDLSKVSEIGARAFARTNLEKVTFKDGAEIGDGAFEYNRSLETAENLKKVKSVGAYAFRQAKLTTADLSSAEFIGDHAFQSTLVSNVTLGDKLTAIGQNPFADCPVETFARKQEVVFNDNTIGYEYVTTYDVSDNVKVINDVIYAIVPNGMELIAYPMKKDASAFTMEEGAVKVGARAFQGAALRNVTLASTVAAIGDKAFYGCENLTVVVFTSHYAPLLEEEFDPSYISVENLPFTGRIGSNGKAYDGLGISKYYMWGGTAQNNFYYGANFVDYIGQIEKPIVMVRPVNGQEYDTYIFNQYFSDVIDGHSAAEKATLEAIALIAALPETITLETEEAIVAAREAFEAITSFEQKSLVDNLEVLEAAEAELENLKRKAEQNKDPEEPTPPEVTNEGLSPFVIVLIVVGSVLVVAGAAVAVFLFLKKKNTVATQTEEQIDNQE